jgi:N-acetylglucosaminyl-diphospho-decaprenol L-rhamnosyltransferase
VITNCVADVAVLIVGFRNPADIRDCLAAISDAAVEPKFDVFICENGGLRWYQELIQELLNPKGPCQSIDESALSVTTKPARLIHVRRMRLRTRSSNVWVGCAAENLGYAGGINAWLLPLETTPGWKGVWILNPDTKPEVYALAALVKRAETGRKGMVGSTILDIARHDEIRCRGGLHWQRIAARTISIGLGEPLDAPIEISAIEAAMDGPSGASMYVTRTCLETIGLMDESYFLFFEDLDWGLRAKECGLGYARASIVWHKRGTTTGSANSLATISRLSVYLEQRNGIHFVRRYFPLTLPLRIMSSLLYAIKLMLRCAPANSWVALQGVLAGLRGEVGRPSKYNEISPERGQDLKAPLGCEGSGASDNR